MFTIFATIAGILVPLGAALDFIATRTAKRSSAAFILASLRRRRLSINKISLLFDKYFGSRVYSWRSLGASAVLFVVTFLAMYLIVYAFTDTTTANALTFSLIPKSLLSFTLLSIFVLFSICADFISYGKTRIFMRAIERAHEPGIAPVLLIADLIASPAIFILLFSAARALSFLVTILLSNPVYQPSKAEYIPEIIHNALLALGAEESDFSTLKSSSDHRFRNKAYLISHRPVDWTDEYANQHLLYLLREGGSSTKYNFVRVDVKKECITGEEIQNTLNFRAGNAYVNSYRQIYSTLEEIRPDVTIIASEVEKVMLEEIERITKAGTTDCAINVISISEQLEAKRVVKHLSPVDIYLASFIETSNDVAAAVGTKMYEYMLVEPENEVDLMLSNSMATGVASFLGLRSVDLQKMRFVSMLRKAEMKQVDKPTFIPFGTLAASSFAASVMFWVFLLWRMALSILDKTFYAMRVLAPMAKIRSLPFSFLAVSATALVGAIVLVLFVSRSIWHLIWS